MKLYPPGSLACAAIQARWSLSVRAPSCMYVPLAPSRHRSVIAASSTVRGRRVTRLPLSTTPGAGASTSGIFNISASLFKAGGMLPFLIHHANLHRHFVARQLAKAEPAQPLGKHHGIL